MVFMYVNLNLPVPWIRHGYTMNVCDLIEGLKSLLIVSLLSSSVACGISSFPTHPLLAIQGPTSNLQWNNWSHTHTNGGVGEMKQKCIKHTTSAFRRQGDPRVTTNNITYTSLFKTMGTHGKNSKRWTKTTLSLRFIDALHHFDLAVYRWMGCPLHLILERSLERTHCKHMSCQHKKHSRIVKNFVFTQGSGIDLSNVQNPCVTFHEILIGL